MIKLHLLNKTMMLYTQNIWNIEILLLRKVKRDREKKHKEDKEDIDLFFHGFYNYLKNLVHFKLWFN